MQNMLLHRMVTRVSSVVYRVIDAVELSLGRCNPPEAFALVGVQPQTKSSPSFGLNTIKDIIGDGFLFAVPKHRRTLERRHKRKYGHPDYVLKILLPRKDLKVCNVCGDDYEAGVLCPTCYKKVIDETKEMQDAIQNELKLDPVEKEVVVLYNGEKNDKPQEFFDGKRIVEVNKPRPAWFSKNLLQQTTQKEAETANVKPTDLG
ncbi:unnamed protein product [Acanthoscelides obtectus]|uniref:Large ribosomal subunit protein bL32m n=1 Tax=Acanthoscelides obtectus TaxID=200917 RepID=A0A9P0K262_ACAOB|nr:unnamed protein product [Acanthoscelides obtectus]CAK1629655.1 39S ribosomal protein L32, mitochondrial [Acanthoscelides obtectus]